MHCTLLFLGGLGAPEIIFLTLIVLLVFEEKIPELMRGLGKGVSSFKKGLKEVDEEIKKDIE